MKTRLSISPLRMAGHVAGLALTALAFASAWAGLALLVTSVSGAA